MTSMATDLLLFNDLDPILDPILEFKGDYHFLSNFHEGNPFVWQGETWLTSEHAYQAAKCVHKDQRDLIRNMPTPGATKRAGKLVELRPDWEQVKDSIMLSIVRAKFASSPDLATKLIATGYAHLEEGNYWKDRYWGVCPAGSGNGKNVLGKILMIVRDELTFNDG